MPFSSSTRFVVAALSTLTALAGCSSKVNEDHAIDSSESALKVTTSYLGKIGNGETKTSHYSTPPEYRSYGFNAKGGDEITVRISSLSGDAMGWITTSSYSVLASNDDESSSTLDSKVVYKVPTGQASRSYRIVFRDYDLLDATFNVTLSIRAASPTTCSYDGQTHVQGDSFEAGDGCNTCSCTSNGVVCTELACACNPATEPNRNYVGNPQQCMVIRYACPTGRVPFSNSCGCGCETPR